MAVDMMARARMPGTRKSTGCLVPVGSTCTAEKNSRNTTGIPSVRKTDSPLVNSMVSSARSWARETVSSGRGPSTTSGRSRAAQSGAPSAGPGSRRALEPVMAR